ncbi:putative molybdenum carrier protein [Marinobacter salarius]|nr:MULTISPECIES: putative molybdenum carrier protein [Gammaproteobacteria]MCC4285556.1 putative molybdenum carrier protein [Marinobacter salarius]
MCPRKVISGGQTGADRAALDAGLATGLAIGGCCPRGRMAEDGPIDDRYPLEEITGGYRQRTKRNVLNADGTVIFYHSAPEGGTEATLAFCIREKKPYKLIDTESVAASTAAGMIREFVQRNAITSLNVAGPRESRCSGMYGFVLEALCLSLSGGGLS